MADLLPPLKPVAIKERLSILFIEKGQLDVLDGAFVVVDKRAGSIDVVFPTRVGMNRRHLSEAPQGGVI